jgi:hypothetical protein
LMCMQQLSSLSMLSCLQHTLMPFKFVLLTRFQRGTQRRAVHGHVGGTHGLERAGALETLGSVMIVVEYMIWTSSWQVLISVPL